MIQVNTTTAEILQRLKQSDKTVFKEFSKWDINLATIGQPQQNFNPEIWAFIIQNSDFCKESR